MVDGRSNSNDAILIILAHLIFCLNPQILAGR